MTFLDFLRERHGRNWVLARRSPSIVRRYGEDVVCLSGRQYSDLVNEYERTTGFAAHGRDGEPCDRIKAASLDMLTALQGVLTLLPSLPLHDPNRHYIDAAHAAIAKAKGA